MSSCADYLEPMLQPKQAKQIVDKTARFIAEKVIAPYECIVFRGMSGALIAPVVAYKLGKPCVPVRKVEEQGGQTHSTHIVERRGDYKSYIILDDLISAGHTCREIINQCDAEGMECRGIVVYNMSSQSDRPPADPGETTDWNLPAEDNTFFISKRRCVRVYCVGYAPDYVRYTPVDPTIGVAVRIRA